ncbi:MAG TPA: sigma-70 family RNA polymerase sigma factor [Mycobacteriales bacterium]|nr:sigma-70 family RNA polymerase sigma factor [Mycobacteriales bacterium]
MMTVDRADEAALRELYDAHAGALLAYAIRLTGGDRGRAEDVVQETLLRAWRHRAALDENRGPLRPWLFTVAHHVAIDAFRARSARPAEVGDAVLEAIPTADDIDARLDQLLISDALSALSAEHRSVIIETYYRGRSVAEAAEVLGVPPGTVKSRTFYALRALKLALAERGVSS